MLASCATKTAKELDQVNEPLAVRSFVPIKKNDQQLVSDLISAGTGGQFTPAVVRVRKSDPLLNGNINFEATNGGLAVATPLVAGIKQNVSQDDAEAIKKLIELTEGDDEFCVVTISNDCVDNAVE